MKMRSGVRTVLALQLHVVAWVALSVSLAVPADAHAHPAQSVTPRGALLARVEAVRQVMQANPLSSDPRHLLTAQATTWTNWPKWSKWSNWANK